MIACGAISLNSCAKQRPCPICVTTFKPACASSVQKLIYNPRQPLPRELLDLLECVEILQNSFDE